MEQVKGIEPSSSDWKSDIIAIILHLRLARSIGLEPITDALEGRCSIQLSYERMVQMAGVEPA